MRCAGIGCRIGSTLTSRAAVRTCAKNPLQPAYGNLSLPARHSFRIIRASKPTRPGWAASLTRTGSPASGENSSACAATQARTPTSLSRSKSSNLACEPRPLARSVRYARASWACGPVCRSGIAHLEPQFTWTRGSSLGRPAVEVPVEVTEQAEIRAALQRFRMDVQHEV
jgi:hypothetical protein